jgi:predicted Zn-dependent protease
MSSFVGIPLFVLLLLPGLVSELMYISVQFFNSQEGISDYNNSSPLSQTIYAQEDSDDEEIDENEGGDDDNENEEGDKEQSATNSIDICCAWDERLADEILTYRIIEDEDEESEDEDEEDESDESEDNGINIEDNLVPSLRYAVENAVKEWNARVSNLKLVEITYMSLENDDADIEVQFVEGFGGMVAGATMIKYDNEGLINKATIILPKAAFYVEYESETFGVQYSSQKLEEIAVHEMGHALGLGHANFAADLMSQRLSNEDTANISECDVTGVLYANQWKLINNDIEPDSPKEDEIDC